jgi:GT2 family glycosyltransferase
MPVRLKIGSSFPHASHTISSGDDFSIKNAKCSIECVMNLISHLKFRAGWHGVYRYPDRRVPYSTVTEGITVAIPSWNGADLLEACLRCIYAQTLQPDRILVVDNASTDDTSILLKSHPRAEHIQLPENRGYAGASQHALEVTTTTLLAVLNNDAEPDEKWIEVLANRLRSDPDVAASFPLSLDTEGRIDSSGDVPTRAGFFYKRGYRRYMEKSGDFTIQTGLLLASGVGAMYRVEAARDVGGWDRGFHSYLEDVDLSLRLWIGGWRISFEPETVVIHRQGRTGGRITAIRAFLASRNESLVIAKNYDLWTLVAMSPSRVLYLCITAFSRFLAGGFLPFLAGKYAFLLSLNAVWRARNQTKRKRKLTYGVLEGCWIRSWISLSAIGGRKAPNAS